MISIDWLRYEGLLVAIHKSLLLSSCYVWTWAAACSWQNHVLFVLEWERKMTVIKLHKFTLNVLLTSVESVMMAELYC